MTAVGGLPAAVAVGGHPARADINAHADMNAHADINALPVVYDDQVCSFTSWVASEVEELPGIWQVVDCEPAARQQLASVLRPAQRQR